MVSEGLGHVRKSAHAWWKSAAAPGEDSNGEAMMERTRGEKSSAGGLGVSGKAEGACPCP